jgi:DNA-binding MarR family transcriptional regulator
MPKPLRRPLVLLLNQAQQALMRRLNAESVVRFDITVPQLSALFQLTREDGARLTDLSEALGLDNAAVTRLAERLERKGLAERRPCPDDARAKRLHLLPLGRERARQGLAVLGQVRAPMERGFSEAELATVARFLRQVITFANEETPS